ncbi:hypothetical protein [Paenibacillus crassostreae]|uniref:Uncharacterized protein n=1 Tax=Paenibacillus crassostreae TaxID=1763538 RepID=A0A167EI64_9BACL|nr:hypothetical protein [Paenibacillus crassostreae]AOZ94885.1 hypothetical protein LPB68_21725 [Paenibacillus crassostreae]OAB75568.1 hypothetical protein PNBC_08015 [Paenibacillus crassostreae]
MAKISKLAQAQKIEDQIKELREKQKQLVEKAQKEIGEHLMDSWDVEDIEQAKKIIDKFQTEAKALFKKENGSNPNNPQPSITNNPPSVSDNS